MQRWPRLSLLPALLFLGCSSAAVSDAGLADAGHADAAGFADAASFPDAAGFPDAAEPDLGAAPDATELDLGIAPDTGEADSGAPDTGPEGPDGGFIGNCPVPPAHVDGPFAAGPPPASANFLLTDSASTAVFRLSIDGTVLDQWPVPLRTPFGVTHDKRDPTGFFVNGNIRSINAGDLYRLNFAGTITATLSYYAPNGTIWGMDYVFGSDAAHDVLGFLNINANGLPTITGAFANNATRWFEGGLFEPRNAQWYGAFFERYACDDGATIIWWATRSPNILELRDFSVNGPLRSFTLAETNDVGGLTRTPRGDFYIVDRQNRRVLHYGPDHAFIDSFGTPGPQPADISYAE